MKVCFVWLQFITLPPLAWGLGVGQASLGPLAGTSATEEEGGRWAGPLQPGSISSNVQTCPHLKADVTASANSRDGQLSVSKGICTFRFNPSTV